MSLSNFYKKNKKETVPRKNTRREIKEDAAEELEETLTTIRFRPARKRFDHNLRDNQHQNNQHFQESDSS